MERKEKKPKIIYTGRGKDVDFQILRGHDGGIVEGLVIEGGKPETGYDKPNFEDRGKVDY